MMQYSLLLVLFSVLLCSSHVMGLVPVPLPQVVLTMRSTSPDNNTHDLLTHILRASNAYVNDYFTSYYNTTGTFNTFGFDHVSVSVKLYGIVPNSSSEPIQTSVELKGYVYYRNSGDTASQVKKLIAFALNDNNRVLFMNSFLKMSNNDFLRSLTAMEVTIDGVLGGSPLPPLPPSTLPPSKATSTSSNSSADGTKKYALLVFLVVAAVVAFVVAVVKIAAVVKIVSKL